LRATLDFKTLIRDFQRLGAGQKLVFFGSIICLISLFFPWHQASLVVMSATNQIQSKLIVNNGLARYPVFGVLSGLAALSALVVFVREFVGTRKTAGIGNGKVLTVLGGELVFVLVIALFVLLSEKQAVPSTDIRFGLFLSIFGHGLVALGGYFITQESSRAETLAAFHPAMPHGGLNIRAEEPEIPRNQLSFSDGHAHQR
jgi:hypothetical protein